MGVKTGNPRGRPKGSPNKASAAKAEEVAASGVTPLDFMLNAMRDTSKTFEQRFEAAKASAAYVHPKLSAVDATVEGGLRIEIVDSDDD